MAYRHVHLVGSVDGEPRRWCIIGQRIAPLTE
jgi:hypothetical protein